MAVGAVQYATNVEIVIRTRVTNTLCQRKIVSLKGMTPVKGMRLAGMLAALACNCAADELSPIAHVAPMPR